MSQLPDRQAFQKVNKAFSTGGIRERDSENRLSRTGGASNPCL
jgi:hypothetical protein